MDRKSNQGGFIPGRRDIERICELTFVQIKRVGRSTCTSATAVKVRPEAELLFLCFSFLFDFFSSFLFAQPTLLLRTAGPARKVSSERVAVTFAGVNVRARPPLCECFSHGRRQKKKKALLVLFRGKDSVLWKEMSLKKMKYSQADRRGVEHCVLEE